MINYTHKTIYPTTILNENPIEKAYQIELKKVTLGTEHDKIAMTLKCSLRTFMYYQVHRPALYYEKAFHPKMLQAKARHYFVSRYERKLQFLR